MKSRATWEAKEGRRSESAKKRGRERGRETRLDDRPSLEEEQLRETTHLPVLNHERLLDTRLEHIQHSGIVLVVADVLEDLLIGNDSERSEDDDDGDVGSDVGKRSLDRVSALLETPTKLS